MADAQVLVTRSRFGAAYYLVGYAVECALKACIAKLTKAEDFHDKDLANKTFTHDLENLAKYAHFDVGQLSATDSAFGANWAQVKDWDEKSRYETHTQIEAEQMIKAVQDSAHGVMQCIRRYW